MSTSVALPEQRQPPTTTRSPSRLAPDSQSIPNDLFDPVAAQEAVDRWIKVTAEASEQLGVTSDQQELSPAVRAFAKAFQSELHEMRVLSEQTLNKSDVQQISAQDVVALLDALSQSVNDGGLLEMDEYPGAEAYVAEAKTSGVCPDV
ncbi:MAG: hypothetical protein WHS89_08940 [Acidimicrobiales bacterium]